MIIFLLPVANIKYSKYHFKDASQDLHQSFLRLSSSKNKWYCDKPTESVIWLMHTKRVKSTNYITGIKSLFHTTTYNYVNSNEEKVCVHDSISHSTDAELCWAYCKRDRSVDEPESQAK